MEYDKSRVYTALNADELKVGSKVILADDLAELEEQVVQDGVVDKLELVRNERYSARFYDGYAYWHLAYLVEPSEEKKLKWTDLKVGDVITKDNTIAMVTMIDRDKATDYHICLGDSGWIPDDKLPNWEKVENEA